MQALTEIIKEGARRFGKEPALTMRMGYRTVTLNYHDLYEMSQKVALFLSQQKLQPGDRVILIAPNSPYWSVVFFGCQLGGYIPVPLNIQSTAEQIKRVVDQTKASVIFAYTNLIQALPPNLRRYNIELVEELIVSLSAQKFVAPEIKSSDIAQILYTSGTTGDPKGVMLSHGNIISNLEAISTIIYLKPGHDKLLSILPLSHILEQTIGLMLPLMHGAHIIYAHTSAAIRSLMNEYQITKMIAVPEFLHILMSRIEEKAQKKSKKKFLKFMMDLSLKINSLSFSRILFYPIRQALSSKLDTVSSGGAPLSPVLEKKWNAIGIYLLQGYGLTETSPVVTTNSYTERKFGSVGKALDNVEIMLADDGEILVKGPNVFQGYYKNEKLTKEAFTADGWFKTGDLGEFDSDNFLYIRGRKKYVIIGPGGQNVYPEDIEAQLNKIPGVIDSAVLSIDRDHTIEIHAVLLLSDHSATHAEKIIEQANKNLASYQQISGWTIWKEEDFPRSATRKIQKEKVKEFLKQKKGSVPLSPSARSTPLIRILSSISGVDEKLIKPNTKLITLHLDSLMRIELVTRVEEDFGVSLNEAEIVPSITVETLQTMIDKKEAVKEPPRLKKWPRSWWAQTVRFFGQYMLYFLFRPWMKLKVVGLENLKDLKSPVIFMPNHLSYLDPLVLTMALPMKLRKKISFAAAHDVLYVYYKPVAWLAELGFNTFPLPRREHEHIAWGLKNIGKMLDNNYSVALFPEGRISEDRTLLELKPGAGLVAVSMGVPVVPVKIEGTATIMPYEKFIPRARATVTVTFSKPHIFSKSESYEDATKQIYKEMMDLQISKIYS